MTPEHVIALLREYNIAPAEAATLAPRQAEILCAALTSRLEPGQGDR